MLTWAESGASFVRRSNGEMMMLEGLVIQSLLQEHRSLVLINVEKFRWVFVVICLNAVRYLRVYTWIGAEKYTRNKKQTVSYGMARAEKIKSEMKTEMGMVGFILFHDINK